LKNVHAVLVHESPECVVDLVRNLRALDPASQILLYNGGRDTRLLDGLPSDDAVHLHPRPRPLVWGKLHPFALACFRFALDELGADTITIVDSDQLAIEPGYAERLADHLRANPDVGMLGNAPERQPPRSRVAPVETAAREVELWRPFARRFPDGEDKLWHWTFWPSTVFTARAARDLVDLFARDELLSKTLRRSRLWATEEVLLPTLVALLGHQLGASPFSYASVRYRARYTAPQVDRALSRPDAYWIHPVPRLIDDPLRARIRARLGGYAPAASSPPPTGSPLLLPTAVLDEMERVEGWLSRPEAELLLAASVQALNELPAPHALVEIGSHCGRATVVLGTAVRALAPDSKVYAIDVHDGHVGARDRGLERRGPTLERFRRTVESAGLESHVETVHEATYRVPWERPISLLVVDGLHDYDSVSGDFRHFEPWLVDGGYVAFHDYAHYYPGVQRLVDELVADGDYEPVRSSQTLVVLRRLVRERAPLRRIDPRRPRRAAEPLVTCVMPTFERREWVPHAVEYFLRQEDVRAELVVVDDGAHPVADLLPDEPSVRYMRLEQRASIGAKRNIALASARGAVFANWDDDDWVAPWRLAYQVEELRRSGAEVCGLSRLLYYEPASGRAWRYAWPAGQRPWIADPTLVFTKEFWRAHPFPDTSMGIDCRLLWNGGRKRIHVLADERFFVGIVHERNTSPKETGHSVWRPIPAAEIHALLGEDLRRYEPPGGARIPA
jgi:hypothetical protein